MHAAALNLLDQCNGSEELPSSSIDGYVDWLGMSRYSTFSNTLLAFTCRSGSSDISIIAKHLARSGRRSGGVQRRDTLSLRGWAVAMLLVMHEALAKLASSQQAHRRLATGMPRPIT